MFIAVLDEGPSEVNAVFHYNQLSTAEAVKNHELGVTQ